MHVEWNVLAFGNDRDVHVVEIVADACRVPHALFQQADYLFPDKQKAAKLAEKAAREAATYLGLTLKKVEHDSVQHPAVEA